MKRFLLYLIMVCTVLSFCACKNAADAANTKTINNEQTETAKQDSEEKFLTTLKEENFTKIPDEAAKHLNLAADAAKILFPDAQGSWMYGYKGTETINGKKCYVFTLFTKSDDSGSKIGVVATDDEGHIFVLNEENGRYETASLE